MEQMEIASALGLPMMLYQTAACEELADKIREFKEDRAQQGMAGKATAGAPPPSRIAVYNFFGTEQELSLFVSLGCFVTVSGRVASSSAEGEAVRRALKSSCPLQRLLVCSDAPYCTPQNIDDAFMREGRNEPSNLPHLVRSLQSVYGLEEADLCRQLCANALEFFGLQTREQQAEQMARDAPRPAGCLAEGSGREKKESDCAAQRASSHDRRSDDNDDDREEEAEDMEDGTMLLADDRGNMFSAAMHDNDPGDDSTAEDNPEVRTGVPGVGDHDRTSARRHQRQKPEAHPAVQDKRVAARSYLMPEQVESLRIPRPIPRKTIRLVSPCCER